MEVVTLEATTPEQKPELEDPREELMETPSQREAKRRQKMLEMARNHRDTL